ncbi:MAG: hypothetical protein ACK5NA_02660 [Enterococcus sp.]
MEWEEVIKEWYPETLHKKSYPVKISKLYTSSQRFEIYEKLTKPQRTLVDTYRRYLIKSKFIEDNYLAATDWVFADFKINPFYHTERRQEKLYCACGRELKVQYIVKSPQTNKELKLGITHFAEHLHVSPAIATSIQQGMTKVDVALDELLWLKQQNIAFPEEIWQAYCLALYHNRRFKHPQVVDERLTVRVAEFRQADLPIYLADYQALKAETKRIEACLTKEPKKKSVEKKHFEDFTNDLTVDVQDFLKNYQLFLRNDLKKISVVETEETLSEAFYQNLVKWLRQTKKESTNQKWEDFQRKIQTSSGRFIQMTIYRTIFLTYCRYGFSENFFYGIPRAIRKGLLHTLKAEKKQKALTKDPAPKQVSKQLLQQVVQVKNQTIQEGTQRLIDEGYQFTAEQTEALKIFTEFKSHLENQSEEMQDLVKLLTRTL